MYPNADKVEDVYPHPGDPSENSIIDQVTFKLDSGAESDAYCSNLDENYRITNNWAEGLTVSMSSAETTSWLRSH